MLPASLTSIGNNAFSDCVKLKSVTFGNAQLSIGELAFGWCLKLQSVTLGDKVQSIGDRAFYACDALRSFTIENPECVIYNNSETIPSDSTINGYRNSTAKAYADKYEKTFVALDPLKLGDVDMDSNITVLDATAIQKHLASIVTLTSDQLSVSDADKDGELTVIDATKIQQFVAELIEEL